MTPQEAADKLNNSEYGKEGSRELFAEMKASGLVAVYGASDDLMELQGAISDEVGCYDGGSVFLTKGGLLENECAESDCPYHAREREKATTIEAVWGKDGISWQYETTIPHVTFDVMEDGEVTRAAERVTVVQ